MAYNQFIRCKGSLGIGKGIGLESSSVFACPDMRSETRLQLARKRALVPNRRDTSRSTTVAYLATSVP